MARKVIDRSPMQQGEYGMTKLKQVFYCIILLCSIFSIESNLSAFTLSKQLDSFIFVILRHVRDEKDNLLWKRCYNSIREFYLETPIVIIDDNSRITVPDEGLDNTIVIRSEYPGAGELLPYYYFHKYRWSSKMIFLHDSMFLKRAFTVKELNNSVKFHWHFDTHASDDNCRINDLLLNLNQGDLLVWYNKRNKKCWNGCFGVASMIDLSTLDQIESQYLFLNSLVDKIKTREDRMALERILGILLFKESFLRKESCSNFGNIFHYPHCWRSMDDATLERLKKIYPGAILKTWHGR